MNPVYAKFIVKDHLVSVRTSLHHYILEFKVKFDNGEIEELRMNTASNFQQLLSCDKIKRGKFFEPLTTLEPWQETLFNCWKNNQDADNNCLYTFQKIDDTHFNCVSSSVSAERLDNIFSKPKSWCAVL